MITEDYVSFEIAKLLKEKGFEVNCYTHYSSDGQNVYYNYQTPSDGINMPTLQMAMKWLREIHKIGVFPSTYINIMGSNTTHVYGTAIVNLNTYEIVTSDCMARDTYNEACETAIKYCLENLI